MQICHVGAVRFLLLLVLGFLLFRCTIEKKTAMEAWHPEHDEYQKFLWRMNPPRYFFKRRERERERELFGRVVVENGSCPKTTLFKVNSSSRHGILLEVVQLLTDLDLNIYKAYISSDGGWFMDVFHVTDALGNKVTDEDMIVSIEKSIGLTHQYPRRIGVQSASEHTALELTGTDRPGLMSEISALLMELRCNVVAAELWTHNARVACLLYITDEGSHGPITDMNQLHKIKESLRKLLKGDDNAKNSKLDVATSLTHTERRLHQMMFADRDYEGEDEENLWDSSGKISVENCEEKGYSVVTIESRNRPKLLFDTLCTLTDMEYVVFHATIDTDGQKAYQEYYIRHIDGRILDSEAERQRVIQCLRAGIKRRVPEGLRLELCTNDRLGLLSETRIFREHGLSVTRADVTTHSNMASNVFYVTNTSGDRVDLKVIEAVRQEIGQAVLQVKRWPRFSLGNLFGRPSQVLYNLGLIKSIS